jgi:uncharacterized membrane protein YdjX (TVP38/TMEM64 family)
MSGDDATLRDGGDHGNRGIAKRAVFALFAITIVVFFALFRERQLLEAAVGVEQQLREFTLQHFAQALAIAFVIYVGVTGLMLPGAVVMSLVIAWLFGFWPAVVLVSFASTTGATLALLLSRYMFRDAVQSRFGDRLAAFNSALEREGAFYLFTLRLIVGVPFFVINLVMGLTPIKVRTFWWVSQLGMLPGTVVYVWAGSSVPTLHDIQSDGLSSILSWQVIVAFALLGVFPLLIKQAFRWRRAT